MQAASNDHQSNENETEKSESPRFDSCKMSCGRRGEEAQIKAGAGKAETVVQETERFLKADLPATFAQRLAAKAHYLYLRHKHFHKGMNRPGNRGRENLLMFMRHWTAGWLKRERYALYKKLPWSFSMGQRLPR
jgi:hypothetical protein